MYMYMYLFVQDYLVEAGLLANAEKSAWDPSTKAPWLGFEIDIQWGCVYLPVNKLLRLKVLLKGVNRSRGIRARYLASLTGKIMSMSLAWGPVARLMTRAMYTLLESRVNWCDMLEWVEDAWEELQIWTDRLTCKQPTDV